MAPGGGGMYRDVVESRTALADYGIAPTETDSRNPPSRKSPAVVGGKPGVHELLECPVCRSVMYPPIHQVHSYIVELITLKMLNLYCQESILYFDFKD